MPHPAEFAGGDPRQAACSLFLCLSANEYRVRDHLGRKIMDGFCVRNRIRAAQDLSDGYAERGDLRFGRESRKAVSKGT